MTIFVVFVFFETFFLFLIELACYAVFYPPNNKEGGLRSHFENCKKAAKKKFTYEQCFDLGGTN